jgi:hypothetical protein
MNANECFELGKEFLAKEDYDQANMYFWKAMEQTYEPDKVALLRQKSSGFDSDVTAVFLQEVLGKMLVEG